MANNIFSDDIRIATNGKGIHVADPDSGGYVSGALYPSSSDNLAIGVENKIIDRKCTIRAGDLIRFRDGDSRTFGFVSASTGSVYIYYPATDGRFGLNVTVGGKQISILSIGTTDAAGNTDLDLGDSACGNIKFLAGNWIRFSKGIETINTNTGVYSSDGTTNRRYLYFNTNDNLILGSNTFDTTSINIFAKYNSYIRCTAADSVSSLYAGNTSLCRNNVNVPGGVTFKINGNTITPKSITVTRNTTNTSAVEGYVLFYPILNIVQINLAFTLKAISGSAKYEMASISSTYKPVITAGLACHVNITADHSTGIMSSDGTIYLYADASAAADKICYISGIYSTV